MAYAGLKLLSAGDKAGEILETFEMAVHLLNLQVKADQPSTSEIEGLLAESVAFMHCSGSAAAPPSKPPLQGKASVMEHLKASELADGQLKRLKNKVKSSQPAKLLADGRTSLNFEILVAGGTAIERLQDVIEWDDEGKIASWVRVFEPRKSQRDWLQLISNGKSNALNGLLDGGVRFAVLDGPNPRCYVGYEQTLEALKVMALRMTGKVSHIGRTREVTDWQWPKELASGGGGAGGGSKKKRPENPPATVQAIIIGMWRPLGSKWYGDEELAMRETAEWCGSHVTKIMWELLPTDHPQAVPVMERLKEKRQRAAQAARRRAKALTSGKEDRANGNRPAWSFEQPYVPPPPKGGLKTAADKVAAIDLLPPPPKTLPPPKKR